MPTDINIKINETKHMTARLDKPVQDTTAELERKLVLLIHGFPGHKAGHNDLYADLQFILTDKGFHTLRFDFFGCGESSGASEEFTLKRALKCLDTLHEWAQEEGYREFVYISEGIGSTIAMMGMRPRLTSQVMMWPALYPKYAAEKLFNSHNVTNEERKLGYKIVDDNRIGLPLIHELEKVNLKPLFQDVTMPLLILHGSADDRYPVGHLDIARKHITSKRIEITTFHGGEHGLPALNHRKSMFFHITEFLEKYS